MLIPEAIYGYFATSWALIRRKPGRLVLGPYFYATISAGLFIATSVLFEPVMRTRSLLGLVPELSAAAKGENSLALRLALTLLVPFVVARSLAGRRRRRLVYKITYLRILFSWGYWAFLVGLAIGFLRGFAVTVFEGPSNGPLTSPSHDLRWRGLFGVAAVWGSYWVMTQRGSRVAETTDARCLAYAIGLAIWSWVGAAFVFFLLGTTPEVRSVACAFFGLAALLFGATLVPRGGSALVLLWFLGFLACDEVVRGILGC